MTLTKSKVEGEIAFEKNGSRLLTASLERWETRRQRGNMERLERDVAQIVTLCKVGHRGYEGGNITLLKTVLEETENGAIREYRRNRFKG